MHLVQCHPASAYKWDFEDIVLICCVFRTYVTRKISLLRIKGYFGGKNFNCNILLEKPHLKSKRDLNFLFLFLSDPELRAVSLKYKLFVELHCTWAEHTGKTVLLPSPEFSQVGKPWMSLQLIQLYFSSAHQF